jgi:hypothetical protein
MKELNLGTGTEMFKDFLQKHSAALSACQAFVKPLASVLERDGIYEIPLDTSILTRVKSGMIFHAPVPLTDKVTKKDLETRTHSVGVLANTVPLIDSVARTILEPGPYVVQLRPLLKGGFAFDFVDKNYNVALSTCATSTDPGRFEAFPEEMLALSIFGKLIDASAGPEICFGPGTITPIGTGPTFPDPPFPGPEWDCVSFICVSFLYWELCVELPTVVAPEPIV